MIDPSPDDDVLYPTDIYDENFFIKYTDDCLENRFDPLNNKQYEPENEYNSDSQKLSFKKITFSLGGQYSHNFAKPNFNL
jgi:hypothetical protein